jgi:hypothetical protein
MAKTTEAEALLAWYSREVPRLLEKEKLFDPEGIFIGDASYVFVPNNPHYENSSVLLFDEENHPVNEEDLSPQGRRRCRWRRCYKWVELIHTNSLGEFFNFVAMHLGPGQDHEDHILYELVEKFLETVGQGVMKRLVVDRGFLDGKRIGHLKKRWQLDTVVALRSDMNVLEDARGLLRLGPVKWQDYYPAAKELPVVGPLGIHVAQPKNKERPPEKVVAFNQLTSWDAYPVELTVVLPLPRGISRLRPLERHSQSLSKPVPVSLRLLTLSVRQSFALGQSCVLRKYPPLSESQENGSSH